MKTKSYTKIENKRKNLILNFKTTLFIVIILSIFIFSFYCFKFFLYNKKNVLIRKLNEEDPRSKGANELCMGFEGYSQANLFILNNTTIDVNENIQLKLCQNINDTKSSCIYKNNSTIIRLAGDINGENNNKNKIKVIQPSLDFIYESELKIYLAEGDICKNGKRYKVQIDLYCDRHNDFDQLQLIEFDPNTKCELKFAANSKTACINFNKYGIELPIFIREIFGGIIFIIGLIIAIFSYDKIQMAISFISIIGCFFIACPLIDFIGGRLILIILSCLSILIATLIFRKIYKEKYSKNTIIYIGLISGYPIAKIINYFISFLDNPYLKLIHCVILLSCYLIGLIIGKFFPKLSCFYGTSIIGAFLMVRGISFVLYTILEFVDDQKIYDLIKYGNYEKKNEMVGGWAHFYHVLFFAFFISANIIKSRKTQNWKNNYYYEQFYREKDSFEMNHPTISVIQNSKEHL